MSGFDLKQINRNDQVIIGGAILAFIASFLPYWGWSGAGFDASISAWHGYAILGLLLIFAAGGITAARVLANARLPKLPVGEHLLVAGLAALGTLLVILRGFTYPHGSGVGGSVGVMWGGYILFIAGIAMTAGAVMNFRASGEKVAWDASALNRPAQAAAAPYAPQGGTVPPAAPPAQPAAPPNEQGTPTS